MRNAIVFTLLLTWITTTANAAETDITGVWGPEGGGGRREVSRTKDVYAIEGEWPVDGVARRVRLEGKRERDRLELHGSVGQTDGIIRAISGEARERPSTDVLLIGYVQDDGSVIDVRVIVHGKDVAKERWVRAWVEIKSIAPSESWDIKRSRAPMQIEFVVHEAPLAVELRVVPAAGSGSASWYAGHGYDEEHALVSRPIKQGALLEPGPHSVRFDGRDGTSARRILLEGQYKLELVPIGAGDTRKRLSPLPPSDGIGLDLPEDLGHGHAAHRKRAHARAARTFSVSKPWKEVIAPVWPSGGPMDPMDSRPVFSRFANGDDGHAYKGLSATADGDFLSRLRYSALAVVSTHGDPGKVYLYNDDTHQTYDPASIRNVDAPWLAKNLAAGALRDLRLLVVWACDVANDRTFSKSLTAAGADCVVTWATPVHTALTGPFFQSLFEAIRLRPKTMSVDEALRGSISRAWTYEMPEARRQIELTGKFVQPSSSGPGTLSIFDARTHMIIDRAGGSPDEPLWPPRYGDATGTPIPRDE